MLVAMYEGVDEVLIFAVQDGEHIGKDEYFKPVGRRPTKKDGDRDPEHYDLKLVELPMMITARLRTEPDRIHR